jgi:general secretion pathway protein C
LLRWGISLSRIAGPVTDRLSPRIGIAGIEIALTIALAYQAAQFFWITLGPVAPFVPSLPLERISEHELAGLTRGNPFLPRHGAEAADTPADNSGYTLYGVRAGGKDGGSAIIAAAGSQQSLYAVGEEVAPGLRLKSVASDHAILAQGARTIRLSMPQGTTLSIPTVPSYLASAAHAPAYSPQAGAVKIDPKKFLAESGLRPRTVNGKITGYTLIPRGEGMILKRAGLAEGDVLTALNGNSITPERYSELEQELLSGPEVSLTVERGGKTRTITLATGR